MDTPDMNFKMDNYIFIYDPTKVRSDDNYLPVEEHKSGSMIRLTNPHTNKLNEKYVFNININDPLYNLSRTANFNEIVKTHTGIDNSEAIEIIKQILDSSINIGQIAGFLSNEELDFDLFKDIFVDRNYKSNDKLFDTLDGAVQLYQDNFIIPTVRLDNDDGGRVGYFPTEKLINLYFQKNKSNPSHTSK